MGPSVSSVLILFYISVLVLLLLLLITFNRAIKDATDVRSWKRGTAPRFMFIFAVGLSLGFALAVLVLSTYARNEAIAMMRKEGYNDVKNLRLQMQLNTSFANELMKGVEEVTARRLAREVRVLCWIMTNPNNHVTKAFHVKTTWGRHCNTLLFMSEGEDKFLPTVQLNVSSGREGLWAKTVEAIKHVHANYREEYDWMLKADDDTYVIVENLRNMLLPYPPSDPLYFGFHFKPIVKPQGYMSGGAGYVLSAEAVDRVVKQAFDGKKPNCPATSNQGAEDANLGKCLQDVDVVAGDSRDSDGKSRFFPFDVEAHVNPDQGKKDWWYWDYIYWPMNAGLNCCSDKPISFHYISVTKMYMLEYLTYHVKPFSVMYLNKAESPVHEEEKNKEEERKKEEANKIEEEKKKEEEKKAEEAKKIEEEKKKEEEKKAEEEKKKEEEKKVEEAKKLEEEKKKEEELKQEEKKKEEEMKKEEEKLSKI